MKMPVSNTAKRIGVALSILVFIMLLIGQCNNSKLRSENARLTKNVAALQDTVKYTKNVLGTLTASKRVLEVTQKELKNQIWLKDANLVKLQKEFKEVKSALKVSSEVQIKEIPVPYKDTVPCVFERQVSVKDKWYSFDVESNQKGLIIKDLRLHNEQYIITGMKREGLFKPLYITVDVANTNPYIKTTDIKAQVIKVEQPFYNKGWFKVVIFAAGIATGATIK